MSTRRTFPALIAAVFALLFFGLGNYLGARQTADGDIRLARSDGRMATFTGPRTPPRSVALRRRDISALITEELRRLDNDAIFCAAMAELAAVVDTRASAERG